MLDFWISSKLAAIVAAAAAVFLVSGWAPAQTTPTRSSASSTTKSITSSSSTSPNSPCNPTNPTSPCYSVNAPRDPCYSALTPSEPCGTTTAPPSQTPSEPAGPTLSSKQPLIASAITTDQAKSQIESAGYSNVSDLRKDLKGVWRASAVKDGQPVSVTLEADGKVKTK